jgi:hypothetical protein
MNSMQNTFEGAKYIATVLVTTSGTFLFYTPNTIKLHNARETNGAKQYTSNVFKQQHKSK